MTRYFFTLLLLLAPCVSFAQVAAVTKNATTGEINGNLTLSTNRTLSLSGNSSLVTGNGPIRFNSSGNMTFGNVGGMLHVTGENNHAIIARSPLDTDGIALVGWSSGGAAAVKATQDTLFGSPALTVWRDGRTSVGGLSSSPAVLIATSGNGTPLPASESALEVTNEGIVVFKTTWNGATTSGGKPLMRWVGVVTALPAIADSIDGDTCVFNGALRIYNSSNSTWLQPN